MISAHLVHGMTVYSNPYMLERQESHRKERKWAHRRMWRKGQRFTIKMTPVVLVMNGALYAHPNTIELLKNSIPPVSVRLDR